MVCVRVSAPTDATTLSVSRFPRIARGIRQRQPPASGLIARPRNVSVQRMVGWAGACRIAGQLYLSD